MLRLALITEFDGTSFSGFQSQKNGRAVQDVLETALGTLFKENLRDVPGLTQVCMRDAT